MSRNCFVVEWAVFAAGLAAAAMAEVVPFKDAAKIKSWDAWDDSRPQKKTTSVLQKEKPCVTWLDKQLRECSAMAIRPWVCLSYGNPVWGSDFRLGMRVKAVTGDPAAFDAWLRYCKACVARYQDIVDEWEIWNEPFNQSEYAEMFYRTAKAIREVQPTAKIYCTAVAFPHDYRRVLDRLKKENALDLASHFIFHPYSPVPETAYRRNARGQYSWHTALGLRELVKSYSPKFDIIQGEAGCPSQLEFGHAMCNIEWTEYAQAKWDLRRAIGDFARGIPTSKFSMIDLQYTFMLQSFGLCRSNTLKEFVYRRPSWYALRNVYALFDDEVKCDRITEIPAGRQVPHSKRGTVLKDIPLWDSPVLIASRTVLRLGEGK